MTQPYGKSFLLLTLLGCLMFPGGVALATTQTRDIFVSPQTGVGVGSVWGVFIGVSKYQHTELNLQYADKDARALHEFFTTQFQGRIHEDQFKVLTNEHVTRVSLLKAIGEVLRRAQREDLVILSLAMHGILDASGRDLYFLTHDADPNFPEAHGISRYDLLRLMDRSKARKIVLFLDACHTGAFGSSSSLVAMRSASALDINRLLNAMGQAQAGRAVLASSSANESSQEGEQFCGGHGAFTCALLTGLKGEADTNRNGLVELRELYDYTYRAVKTSTDGYQNPSIEGRYDNGLPLAYAAGGASVLPSATADVTGSGGASSAEMARVLAQLEVLQKQMAEMNTPQPDPPLVVAKAPTYSAPQRMGREITGKDGAPMVLIPEGEFMMGSSAGEGDDDEHPRHRVHLDAFYLDQYEVTTSRYGGFMRVSGRDAPRYWKYAKQVGNTEKPVIGVDWHDANAYCDHYGKRLPTEAEWEKAARGTDERMYPWGNDAPTRRHANFDQCCDFKDYKVLTTVGSRAGGKSPYGVYDMAGNVWEWTADWYGGNYYQQSPERNPTGPSSGTSRVLRGGSWAGLPFFVRSASRNRNMPSYRLDDYGFRCAQDAP